jgi:hypothetical protein
MARYLIEDEEWCNTPGTSGRKYATLKAKSNEEAQQKMPKGYRLVCNLKYAKAWQLDELEVSPGKVIFHDDKNYY